MKQGTMNHERAALFSVMMQYLSLDELKNLMVDYDYDLIEHDLRNAATKSEMAREFLWHLEKRYAVPSFKRWLERERPNVDLTEVIQELQQMDYTDLNADAETPRRIPWPSDPRRWWQVWRRR